VVSRSQIISRGAFEMWNRQVMVAVTVVIVAILPLCAIGILPGIIMWVTRGVSYNVVSGPFAIQFTNIRVQELCYDWKREGSRFGWNNVHVAIGANWTAQTVSKTSTSSSLLWRLADIAVASVSVSGNAFIAFNATPRVASPPRTNLLDNQSKNETINQSKNEDINRSKNENINQSEAENTTSRLDDYFVGVHTLNVEVQGWLQRNITELVPREKLITALQSPLRNAEFAFAMTIWILYGLVSCLFVMYWVHIYRRHYAEH
jgi:hypothetical protein